MTIRVSTRVLSSSIPVSARFIRLRPSNSNGLVHDGDGQGAHFAGDFGDDRRATGTGATTHAGGDKNEVSTLQ